MQALEIALFDAFAGKGMAAAEAASAAVGTGEVALYLGHPRIFRYVEFF